MPETTAPDNSFSIPAVLRRQPYFAPLAEQSLSALARQAVRRKLAPDEVIFLEGEPSAGLWLIERGRVKVYKMTAEGREYVLHLMGPGDTFNDIPALDSRPNAASAMAVTELIAWVFPAVVLQEARTIAKLWGKLSSELAMHTQKEELLLFPYTRRLLQAQREGELPTPPPFGSARELIETMGEEHDQTGEYLAAIEALSNGYRPPEDACNTYRALYSYLKEFDA